MDIPLIIRTVVHLKPVQVLNRIWRKRPLRAVRTAALPERGVRPLVDFPTFFTVWDGSMSFTFLNETHRLETAADWNNPAWKKLWLYNLHYFDCLRQSDVGPLAGTDAARAAREPYHLEMAREPVPDCRTEVGRARRARRGTDAACSDLIDRWIAENPVGKGNGWEPYPISLRVVNWIKYFSRVPTNHPQVFASLATQVRHLEKRLEYHLLANHLLANAKALVFAGTFFEGPEADRWYRKGMAIYRRQLPEQVLDDGVHFELSAMYHSIMFEDVLDCLNVVPEPDRAFFREYAEKMCSALRFLTGPDGQIVKFNDAADGIALTPETLLAYAAQLGVKGTQTVPSGTRTSGFVRQEAGGYVLMAKCGAIGPRYQPGHAHADTFSFELWRDGTKIVTDTGTDRYVVDDERRRQRGTAAHNTVMIDGRNSSEVWAGHRVGRGFDPRTHQREFDLCADGLHGRDILAGTGEHEVVLSFHSLAEIHPAIEVRAEGVTFVREAEPALICEEFGKQSIGHCVRFRARVQLPLTIDWSVA